MNPQHEYLSMVASTPLLYIRGRCHAVAVYRSYRTGNGLLKCFKTLNNVSDLQDHTGRKHRVYGFGSYICTRETKTRQRGNLLSIARMEVSVCVTKRYFSALETKLFIMQRFAILASKCTRFI